MKYISMIKCVSAVARECSAQVQPHSVNFVNRLTRLRNVPTSGVIQHDCVVRTKMR